MDHKNSQIPDIALHKGTVYYWRAISRSRVSGPSQLKTRVRNEKENVAIEAHGGFLDWKKKKFLDVKTSKNEII